MFLALKGNFRIEFRDKTVELAQGEFVIVPRGVEHRPLLKLKSKFCCSSREMF